MYVVTNNSRTHRIRRRVAFAAAALIGGLSLGALSLVLIPLPDSPIGGTVRCEEDQSCWDCETMGNGVCGPARVVTLADGRSVVVDAYGNILGDITEP